MLKERISYVRRREKVLRNSGFEKGLRKRRDAPGALDYNTSKEILKLIEDVNKKYGNTIIMVTHNEAIKNMADHVIKLRDGAVRHNDINTNKVSAEELEW